MDHLDEVYHERAALTALLAYLYPSAMTPSTDLPDPGWWTLFVYMGGKQLTWHISPDDLHLFDHVHRTYPTDPYVQWDGHTTPEKYQRIADYIRGA